MNVNEIFEDIKSDRVKKVIIDTDAANEMDDQYAIAYAIGLDRANKIDLLSINATPFGNCEDFKDTSKASYEEIIKVLEITGALGSYPVYEGSETSITLSGSHEPIESPAARNIIKTALEAEETIYVLSLGTSTNITSALLLEPKIKDKLCIVWLAGHAHHTGNGKEYNINQDFVSSQLLFNMGVNLIQMPAYGGGTEVLKVTYEKLRNTLSKDTEACRFFAYQLPERFRAPVDPEKEYKTTPETWVRIIWDIAAPGIFAHPEAYDLSIVAAPAINDDGSYLFDNGRYQEIYMNSVNPDIIIDDTLSYIASFQ